MPAMLLQRIESFRTKERHAVLGLEFSRAELANVGLLSAKVGLTLYLLLGVFFIRFRSEGPILCLVGVTLYYFLAYEQSNLKKLNIRYIFFAWWAFLWFKTFHSVDVPKSFTFMFGNSIRGFVLFFAALEFVRRPKDLLILAGLFLSTSVVQGLDGIYQHITGVDFFYGLPTHGTRLTGTISYMIGFYMVVFMLPSLGTYMALPRTWNPRLKAAVLGVVLSPAVFLLIMSQSRGGYLGFLAGLGFLFVLYRGISLRLLAGLAAAMVLGSLLGPKRLTLEFAMRDGRFAEIWPFAWQVFTEFPVLGVGVNGFRTAYEQLGMQPVLHGVIDHPHNFYL